MKKLIVKLFFGVLIFFGFLTLTLLYLNKENRALEESTKLILLPNEIPIRSEDEQFYVYILLNSQVNKISAVDTVIRFDQNILEVVDVVPLGIFPTYPDASRALDNKNGLVFLSAVAFDTTTKTFTEPFQSIGLFGRISFEVKKSQATTIDFVFTPGKTSETNLIEAGTGKNILLDKNQILGAIVEK